MTPENLLMSGLTAVTGVLCYFARLLWARSEDCEKDRRELRVEIEKVKDESGELRGREFAYKSCPANPCPFRREDGSRAFSITSPLMAIFAVLYLSGCATHAVIHARAVTVTVSPDVSLRVQMIPIP